MTRFFSEAEVMTTVVRLSRDRLRACVEAGLVAPAISEGGPAFSPADVARLELICDLCDEFDLEEDALAIVMSLIDQLHGLRAELRALARAVEAQPAEVRERILEAVLSFHRGEGR